MPITLNFELLRKQVTKHTLILTPNARTQKAISAGLVSSLNEGDVIYAPAIKSFSQWQSELWQDLSFYTPLPAIIGSLELKTWLKDQISADEDWQLTNELGVAEKVLDGYRVLSQWALGLADLKELETVENQYFVKWVSELQAFLNTSDLIPQFQQCSHLVESLQQSDCVLIDTLPRKILLVSFNQLTPGEQNLLQTLQRFNIAVESFYPRRELEEMSRVEFNDFNDELAFAANLSARLSESRPEHTIGVVVHQLSSHLEKVHQYFSDSFQANESLPWWPLEKTKYNVSAGQKLQDLPMISMALQILQFNGRGFELATMRLLKNSPFIDWGENAAEVRRFLHLHALKGYSYYSFESLLNLIEKDQSRRQLHLLKKRILGLQSRPTSQRPMNAWVDVWRNELRLWGWLENYSMDAFDTKLKDEFQTALSECLTLSRIYRVCSESQAREFLLQVLKQTPFQLPSDRTNVHVLGVLEATGLEFDELILVGFNRDNWPGKAQLNPFLPVAFQQKNKMPGSSAEREFEYTRNLSEGLMQATERLWVTQSKHEGNASYESPFFSHLPLVDASQFIPPKDIAPIIPDYHWINDEKIELPIGDIRGGAYLLSYYASCPFKALSQFQFNIRPEQMPQKGIEAKTKGAWLHRALELLWLQLKTQQALLELSEAQQAELIADVLHQAQKEFEGQLHATAASEVIQLEYEKLHSQIVTWLSLEKEREPFEVSTEVSKNLSLGALSFQFRIDRLDTNLQGGLEIIDYKSGMTDVRKWLGPRPDEAQMPAYVLACENEAITSLSYARIKTGDISRSGVWFDPQHESGFRFLEISEQGEKDRTRYYLSNAELIDLSRPLAIQWRDNLQALANNIAQGYMPVSPKHPIDSCRYCDFSSFCRINEIQNEQSEEQTAQQKSNKVYATSIQNKDHGDTA